MAHLVEEMFSFRQVPWHGLGRVVDEAPTSEQALELAGLNWEVLSKEITIDGKIAEGFKANVRSTDNKVLGIVTDKYSIVQNKEAFSFTDKLVGGGDVRYETAGSLREGRVVWMLAQLNRKYDLLGDDVAPYLCFTNTHDGSGSVKVLMTPVRIVCNNTLNIALNGATRQWSMMHTGDISKKLEEAEKTLFKANKYLDALQKEANRLVNINITPAIWEELVDELIPVTDDMTDRMITTITTKRQALHDAMMQDDIKKFHGTGWAVVNAIADHVAHTRPSRLTATYQENNFHNIISGNELVDKAVKLLVNA
jgi:phage/plasmid-like protein (TIGR03299 family)